MPKPYFDSEEAVLYHGDCLEVLGQFRCERIQCAITDLPYGMTDLAWDKNIPIAQLWDLLKKVVVKNAQLIFTASQPFTSLLVASNLKWFRTEWVWKKNAGSNFGTVKWHPMKEHESVLVFGENPGTYNPIKQPRTTPIKAGYKNTSNTGKRKAYSGVTINKGFTVTDGQMRVPSSVQEFNRERGFHPNQKPIALMEYFIKTYTNQGDTVLDCCMGSGTTGVAAIRQKRRFIGIDNNLEYCKTATKRIEEELFK